MERFTTHIVSIKCLYIQMHFIAEVSVLCAALLWNKVVSHLLTGPEVSTCITFVL